MAPRRRDSLDQDGRRGVAIPKVPIEETIGMLGIERPGGGSARARPKLQVAKTPCLPMDHSMGGRGVFGGYRAEPSCMKERKGGKDDKQSNHRHRSCEEIDFL